MQDRLDADRIAQVRTAAYELGIGIRAVDDVTDRVADSELSRPEEIKAVCDAREAAIAAIEDGLVESTHAELPPPRPGIIRRERPIRQ